MNMHDLDKLLWTESWVVQFSVLKCKDVKTDEDKCRTNIDYTLEMRVKKL